MPDGKRLWRTSKGDLVEDGHPEAQILAYGTDDAVSEEDAGLVRSAKKASPKPSGRHTPKQK